MKKIIIFSVLTWNLNLLVGQESATIYFMRPSEDGFNLAISETKKVGNNATITTTRSGDHGEVVHAFMNDQRVCKGLVRGQFKSLEVTPGKHEFRMKVPFGKKSKESLTLETIAGKTYYLLLDAEQKWLKMKFYFEELDESKAQELIENTVRSKKDC